MSWLKKLKKKVKKSLRRMSHGKFHITSGLSVTKKNPLYRILPKSIKKNIRHWGDLKKSHRLRLDKLLGGNNSAQAQYTYTATSPYLGSSYRYSGRRLGDMY